MKEGNPLLLPLAIPFVVAVETAMFLSPSADLGPAEEMIPPAYDPLQVGGRWQDASNSLLVENNTLTMRAYCGVIVARFDPENRDASVRPPYKLALDDVQQSSGCLALSEDVVAMTMEVEGRRLGRDEWIDMGFFVSDQTGLSRELFGMKIPVKP